jgi:hypothetical protein
VRELIYLYGFVPSGTPLPPDALTGIDERRVELRDLDGIAAVLSHVNADVYDSTQIENRLQDLDWVAEQGLAHERVVAWFVDRVQIIPASLFTLYSSAEALQTAVAEQRAIVAGELERLAGQREWDLKVSYNAQTLLEQTGQFSDAVRQLDTEISAAAPGRRYLLERKRSEVAKSELGRVARQLGNSLLEQVRPLAVDTATLPIPQTAQHLPVVLHAALLVAREREGDLIQALERLQSESERTGVHLTFSGPWAPYRFVRHARA